MQCFSAHFSNELIRVSVIQMLVVFRKRVQNVQIFFFRQEVEIFYSVFFLSSRVDNHVTLVINNQVKLLRGKSKEVADFVRKRTEIPDVRNRNNQTDMSCSFTSYFLFRY